MRSGLFAIFLFAMKAPGGYGTLIMGSATSPVDVKKSPPVRKRRMEITFSTNSFGVK